MWGAWPWCKYVWHWPGPRKRSPCANSRRQWRRRTAMIRRACPSKRTRGFTDLALLTPGVTQDARGLTSDSNGDLSFGGTRGFQNSFLVDGADNNNSFFAQARGRYRAPYQFSNEVIKEFRVSSNAYSAELGKAGGAVFNVVTKSGTNDWHGSAFYYLRDRIFDAQQSYVTSQPDDRQQQFGGTIGGPIRKDRLFFYAGFDQHLLTVP